MSNLKAQTLRLEPFLPKEYQYIITVEPEQEGMFATNYDAVHPDTQVASFEIIVNQMPKSMVTIEGMSDGIERNAKDYGSAMQLTLLQEEAKDNVIRRLYQIKNELSTVLMLMYQSGENLTVVEVEFHPADFKVVPLERWQNIFWQIHQQNEQSKHKTE
ncbi:hypothetical protein [Sphingobacterium corticibacter]|nr:hypothetical protein [Sphingobacterium corticibacter]